jgi:hypothetical protein
MGVTQNLRAYSPANVNPLPECMMGSKNVAPVMPWSLMNVRPNLPANLILFVLSDRRNRKYCCYSHHCNTQPFGHFPSSEVLFALKLLRR